MSIVTIGGIPVYDAQILDEDSGMIKISLVDDPAVMSNFQAFDAQKKLLMYEVADEEKRLVRGVVMRADFPIFRRDKEMGEYYIIYKADTIRQMAEKYLVENRQNNINLMHEADSDVDGVKMVQFFIKDSAAGVSPANFDEIADGSLFGEFHVTNDEVWGQIKDGTYKGFSLEGVFDLTPEQDKDEIQVIVDSLDGKFKRIFKNTSNSKTMSKLSRLKAALAKAFAEFGNITTDKGVLAWDGDDDLKAGDSVYIEDAEGNRTPAEDGDYKTEDNKTIVVVDGKVSEIKDPEAEVEPVSEEMGKVATDKGDLLYDGEEDLKEGDSVFIEKDGENVPAEDGDYTTEDGKVIKVVDGKVESITDPAAEVAPTDANEVKAKAVAKFKKIKQAFEESFDTKKMAISNAIAAVIDTENFYLVDAGEDFGVVETYNEDWTESHYFRYSITWNEDRTAKAADPVEVKLMFVPMDMEYPFTKSNEEEMKSLKAENASLKAQVAKLKKTPAAKPAHEEVKITEKFKKTGVKGLDNLARILSAE